ncbi:FtsX-like permease family protein [Guptibacillus algicola]|uniref:FtsX-like permease family protein n=1 Tax=Guptibacillus algicola TaxID=225844 RepID=UPI001CD49ECB|nr:ABC transporter permease [Alkalihalobacillus algicola]MCA0987543.1 ABC transporter permease [Alkalihalobacillus algicola]
MSTKQLILRNLQKNVKNYYLYLFALVFTVALYFTFVTLQFAPAISSKESINLAAMIRTTSIFLIVIIGVFLFYANNLFIKRRSKEIGLFQLIGMTKSRIFFIISLENAIVFLFSIVIGTFIGFALSKFILMIFFKVIGIEESASLFFSMNAFWLTLLVFSVIFLLVMVMNYVFLKRRTILHLFSVTTTTEERVKKISIWEILMGILGIVFILLGYYVSSKLFDGDFNDFQQMMNAMVSILGLVIVGTYLFYKGSVRFITNLIRRQKNGYLDVNEVLSLSSIMFRMKSNAFMLTVITTVSAVAIGLLSLSYISFYSAEKNAEISIPDHFAFTDEGDAERFGKTLKENSIPFVEKRVEYVQKELDISSLIDTDLELTLDTSNSFMTLISEDAVSTMSLREDEVMFTGYNHMVEAIMPLKKKGTVYVSSEGTSIPLTYMGLEDEYILNTRVSPGGLPTAVVDEKLFSKIREGESSTDSYVGINVTKSSTREEANTLFHDLGLHKTHQSQLDLATTQKQNMGLVMFIVAYLGLTFLITSGCILYFKQMDESEEEKPSYRILRKLGYSKRDLLRGIAGKQVFNFGIPLIVGLLHSYFAVRSGWFFFGTTLWTPMIIVMVLYTILYSVFGLLSVKYFKKVIREVL